MIVVHQKDRTSTMLLKALYDGLEAYVMNLDCSNKSNGAFVVSYIYARNVSCYSDMGAKSYYFHKR